MIEFIALALAEPVAYTAALIFGFSLMISILVIAVKTLTSVR